MTGAILLQIVLIALNAVFASTEIAVISMNDAKLERLAKKGNKQAKRLVALTAQPARFLATIQVAITLAGFLGSAYAADNFAAPLVQKLLTAGVRIPQSTLNSICVCLRRVDSQACGDEQDRTDRAFCIRAAFAGIGAV